MLIEQWNNLHVSICIFSFLTHAACCFASYTGAICSLTGWNEDNEIVKNFDYACFVEWGALGIREARNRVRGMRGRMKLEIGKLGTRRFDM